MSTVRNINILNYENSIFQYRQLGIFFFWGGGQVWLKFGESVHSTQSHIEGEEISSTAGSPGLFPIFF